MKLLEFKNRLESIQNLPTLPVVIEHLGRALDAPDSDANSIAEIIEDDPAIAARIMKVVNSSLYFGTQPVASLQTAIVRLGLQAVSNIAMSVAVFSTFPMTIKTEFDRTEFWRHCIFTGIAADIVQKHLPRFTDLCVGRDVLHLCGLLHDIGKIVFEQYFHEPFARAVQISKAEDMPLFEAEIRIIGFDHAQVGAWLGRKWNLSEQVLEVIRWHHKPQNAGTAHKDLVAACHLADLAVNTYASTSFKQGNFNCGHASDPDKKHLDSIVEWIDEEAASASVLMSFLQ